jgi:hypothetical protein
VVAVILLDEEFEVGDFLGGEDEGLGVDARAFMEETAFPVTEVGTVDFCALRRFASMCRRVAICDCGWQAKAPAPL